jgi:hypothetical protein
MNVRIGYFFAMVGALILFIFAASYMNQTPQFNICVIGAIPFALGVFLIIRYRKRGGEAERFRYIRKMRSRNKKD